MIYDYEDALSTEQVAAEERDTPCEFITGAAGTGKTYGVVKAVAADAAYGVLSSTTGISAVNLGAITVHSLLRYSTTDVLRDHFLRGGLTRVLHGLARSHRRLIVDECSMADAEQLDLWYRAVAEANRFTDVPEPMGITLVGDFAQLPPVKAKWAWEASCWERFERNTTRLTRVWRQDNESFLFALNLTRRGDGQGAVEVLSGMGARFESVLDTEFEGTTILPRNDQVSRYNAMALDRVPGIKFTVESRRWGQQRSEWGQSVRTKEWGVPPQVELKVGAYVMLLANQPDGAGGFEYVNGDCGWIQDFFVGDDDAPTYDDADKYLVIKLARNGEEVNVSRIVREVSSPDRPDGWSGISIPKAEDAGGWVPRPHYRQRVRRYVTGQVEYFPVRLAYATSVHKSQSLTLDKVQVDFRNPFFKQPGMLYVALSRCRTLEGLRLVGQREVFAKHCTIDERIRRWL